MGITAGFKNSRSSGMHFAFGACYWSPYSLPCYHSFRPPTGPACSSHKVLQVSLLKQTSALHAGSVEDLQADCYGCGSHLQTQAPSRPGFVEQDRYLQKKQYKQLNQLLCRRCRELSHGAMVPAVEDAWSKRQAGPVQGLFITPNQLRQELTSIREQRALIVFLVDILDVSGSLMPRIRDFVGRNPVIVVGTKADLLPKGTDMADVTSWLKSLVSGKKLNAIHLCLASSKTRNGIPEAAAFIRRNRLGRNVCIVGAANVGKSAFIRALMGDMASMSSRQFDPAAANSSRHLPTTSAMPGTTLRLIPLQAFHTGGYLFDTPGLHVPHRLLHLLPPGEAKSLLPRGRLKPFVPPTPSALTIAPSANPRDQEITSATYLWGGLARIDVIAAPKSCALTFYTFKPLAVTALSYSSTGEASTAGSEADFGSATVASFGGLRLVKQVELRCQAFQAPLANVAISGLPGWASISAAERGLIKLDVWAPAGIEVFIRPPLPCPDPALLEH